LARCLRVRSFTDTAFSLFVFHTVHAGAYWHKIHIIHACAFAIQTKLSIISCRLVEFSDLFCFFSFVSVAKISTCNFKLFSHIASSRIVPALN